ncbi:MAG TPA: response regulator transcription factor [Spirochaetia bacterium]|nr:response regulator transcription factor [Spirochaetia bacterium]
MDRRISFLVVEDHPIYRQGLVELVESDSRYLVSSEAGSFDDALKAVDDAAPDIALVDISLFDKDGLDFVRILHTKRPDVPILVISMHDEKVYASRALAAGAKGYVMKYETAAVIRDAIATVLSGHVFLSQSMRLRLVDTMFGGERRGGSVPLDRLSEREFQIFELIALGYGPKEISDVLNLSVKTVDAYRDRLKQKLDIRTASELRKFAATWWRNVDK